MRNYLIFAIILSVSYFPGFAQVLSQTKTATYLNNLNNFRDIFGDKGYPDATAAGLAADDTIYGCTSKLIAIRDSTTSFADNSVSSLALQGFGFTIPDDATIVKIEVKIRRFKTGSAQIGDYNLSLMKRYQCGYGPCTYGVFWTYKDNYPGKIYPDTETEYVFSQRGSGNNGGLYHNETYQWTPAIVNHMYFGVRIDNYPPVGKGSVQVCYDRVTITVYYT